MKRTFIATEAFTRQIAGNLAEEHLREVEIAVMQGLGKTIPGTNGLKKIRCRREGHGKSGGWRIIFADYPKYGITFFIAAFPKNVKENLTREETNELKKLKKSMDVLVEKKYGRKEK